MRQLSMPWILTVFFFSSRRRHTRLQGDWSSDVCSSDLHPMNAGLLYLGRPKLVPGTPLGIMRMLAEYGIETQGARAVVVGRSSIVGKPIAHLLLQAHATVTICHSRTQDLQRHTLDADIL